MQLWLSLGNPSEQVAEFIGIGNNSWFACFHPYDRRSGAGSRSALCISPISQILKLVY